MSTQCNRLGDVKCKTIMIVVFVISLFLLVVGCSKQPDKSGGQPLAEVSGVVLTSNDFDFYLASVNRQNAQSQQRERIFEDFLNKEILTQAAVNEGYEDSSDYQRRLKAFKREVLSQLYLDQKLQARLTDEQLATMYETRKDEFKQDEIHVAHLLIRENAGEIEKRMLDWSEQFKGGKKFEELVLEHSQDQTTKLRGGDLGWMPINIAIHRFGESLLSVSKDKLYGPVKSERGWHLVKVIEPMRTRTRDLPDVKKILLEQKRTELVPAIISELKENQNVRVFRSP